jgi:hypothetical protein
MHMNKKTLHDLMALGEGFFMMQVLGIGAIQQ